MAQSTLLAATMQEPLKHLQEPPPVPASSAPCQQPRTGYCTGLLDPGPGAQEPRKYWSPSLCGTRKPHFIFYLYLCFHIVLNLHFYWTNFHIFLGEEIPQSPTTKANILARPPNLLEPCDSMEGGPFLLSGPGGYGVILRPYNRIPGLVRIQGGQQAALKYNQPRWQLWLGPGHLKVIWKPFLALSLVCFSELEGPV